MAKNYWLMKSEPTSYGIEHLERDGTTPWTGIRNYQSRNFMRDGMQVGDSILFYHSSCPQPGVYGLAKVVSAAHLDETQFDTKSHYFEPRATKEKPVWQLVDISFVRKFKEPVLLSDMRSNGKLSSMIVLRPRNRLSITPVSQAQFEEVLNMA